MTIKTISEKCGVSVAAVSKALNHQPGISQEKAEMVRRTAREMGYFPNAAARTLKTNRSHNIGILFQNGLAHEYFSVILEAIRNTAESRGYDITFLRSHCTGGIGYYEHARHRQCDGVIIAAGLFEQKEVYRLAESEIPVVSIDQVFNGRTAVLNDNVGSTEAIVRYLHGMGHRRIAFIHGEMGDVTRQRLAGFHRACRDLNISVPDEYIVPAKFHEPKESGLATRKLLACSQRPTCILYPDDISYLGGLTELESQGLSVPEDMSCFGYDGIHMASVLRPRLSTYQQNAQEIGRQATMQLLSAIEDAKYYVSQIVTVTGEIQTGSTVKDLNRTE